MLEFKRSATGVRTAQTTCLFSGSRGEVCTIEPLRFECAHYVDNKKQQAAASSAHQKALDEQAANNPIAKYSLLAMASFTKLFVVALRPKLNVLFAHQLSGSHKYLPIISWKLAMVPTESSAERHLTPVLGCARDSSIKFFKVEYMPSHSAGAKHSR